MLLNNRTRKLAFKLIGVIGVVVSITALLSAKFDVVSEGEGVLSINDSNVKILSSSSGIIKEINVTKGDEVSVGEHLLVISNNEDINKRELLKYNKSVYEKEIHELTLDQGLLKEIIASGKFDESVKSDSVSILKIKNKYEIYIRKTKDFEKKSKNMESKIVSLEEQKDLISKKSNMLKDSLGTTVKYIDSKFELEKIKLQVLDSELQLQEAFSLVQAAYFDFVQLALDVSEQKEDNLKKNNELLANTNSELSTVSDRIHLTDIISTVDGTVLSTTEGLSKGVFIERNSEIMVLKRADDGVYIEGKIDSKFRPFISIGSEVKVRINAPGIKDYFYGHISGISADSFDYEDIQKAGERYYSIKVLFDNKSKSLENAKTMLGIKTAIYVINDEMTLFEYLVSVFNKDLDFTVW